MDHGTPSSSAASTSSDGGEITGVQSVDSRVANHIVQTVEAARLMGAQVIIAGISPEIAQTMVTLEGAETALDLEEALALLAAHRRHGRTNYVR